MKVSLVEQMVNRPPRNMQGWRMYRIEYGGHAECCNVEGVIWLPEWFNPDVFEEYMRAQVGAD